MLTGALELFLVALGLIYFVATTAAGLRVIRQTRKSSRHARRHARQDRGRERRLALAVGPAAGQATGPRARLTSTLHFLWHMASTADRPVARASVQVDSADWIVYFIVPCLNEERVIEESLRNLLRDPRGIAVVVDDASDDRTARIAAGVSRDRVIVVRRELPDARMGKGPALNAGFGRVLADAAARGIAASRIAVCVMDADGRLSDGALDAVLPLFNDSRVGGVQLPVRIRRVRRSVLTLLQDLEFWGVCAVAQLGRIGSGTVSLGGNGQFTRLAALLELGANPWRARLTEDLDLALALATAGWRLTSTPEAYVSQQGLTRLRALINQRARWYQGHMQAGRWLPRLWTCRRLSHLSMLEMTLYLLVPWTLVLPWSLIFNYNLVLMALWVAGWVTEPGLGQDATQRVITVAVWYAVSCIPIWMAGYLYSRQRRKAGPLRALLLGHLLLIGNYITYIACWRAFFRLIAGANGWQKTSRHRERSHRAAGRLHRGDESVLAGGGAVVLSEDLTTRPMIVVPPQRQPSVAELMADRDGRGRVPGISAPDAAVRPAGHRALAGSRPRGRPGPGAGSHRATRERAPTGRG